MALGLLVAEACGGSPPAPTQSNTGNPDAALPLEDTGAPPASDGDGGDATVGSSPDASSEAGDAAGASDAVADHFDAGPPPPLCSPDASVGTGTFVLGTPASEVLGAVTPDELVIAWTVFVDGGTNVDWAERATSSDVFGATQILDPSFGAAFPGKVALSGDGLRLAFASADTTMLIEVSRAARGTAFNALSGEDFPDVNPSGGSDGNPGRGPFGNPALSPDFQLWGFVRGSVGLVTSQKQVGVWSATAFPSGLVPPGSGATTMSATGWSEDDQTFFYWDSTANVARMAWKDPFSMSFVSTTTIGSTQLYAYPAAACTKLYYSAQNASGDLDIFVAPLQ